MIILPRTAQIWSSKKDQLDQIQQWMDTEEQDSILKLFAVETYKISTKAGCGEMIQ